MRLKWKLTIASLKMFFRQREAVVWTLVLPIFMIILFSLVDFNGIGRLELGVVNQADAAALKVISALREVRTLAVIEGPYETELLALERGERDLVLVISGFEGVRDGLTAYINNEKPQEAQLGTLIIQQVLDNEVFQHSSLGSERVVLNVNAVQGRNLTYIDFLIPGVVSMSIMQMGIFGVAFSFVSLKKRGILRRLFVTPIRPNDFILAQIITRLIVVMLQISLLVGVGVLFLDLHFSGNVGGMFVVGVLGALVFLGIGFAIAGVSRSEDQVAPLANIIAMPMILLSGVFFSRASLPDVINAITGYFPLTYLTDTMRAIVIDGATLGEVGWGLLGLLIWSAVSCLLAIKLFRWE